MSTHIVISRTFSDKVQTLGELVVFKDNTSVLTLKTLELPWLDNMRRQSCIPAGTYKARKREGHESGSFKYQHIHIMNVPNRTWILIHRGNYYHQILGCILVGTAHRDIDGDGHKDVINSTQALNTLLSVLPQEFTVEIRNTTVIT